MAAGIRNVQLPPVWASVRQVITKSSSPIASAIVQGRIAITAVLGGEVLTQMPFIEGRGTPTAILMRQLTLPDIISESGFSEYYQTRHASSCGHQARDSSVCAVRRLRSASNPGRGRR